LSADNIEGVTNVHTVQNNELNLNSTFYELKLHYNDPFLKQQYQNEIYSDLESTQNGRFFEKPQELKEEHWPQIIFFGELSGENERMAFLKLDGKNLVVRKKDKFDNIEVRYFNEDSIELFNGISSKVFKKQ
jgi:hypothetical protein